MNSKPSLFAALGWACLMNVGSLCCSAQSNVYSLAVYSAGTSYSDLCSLTLPFPPFKYKLTEISWREDVTGFTIMDIRRTNSPSDRIRQELEVQCDSERFGLKLYSGSLKNRRIGDSLPTEKSSGDLAQWIMQRTTNRGGHASTNSVPTFQTNWLRHSQTNLEIFILEGDHFANVQNLLEQACGKPDARIMSSTPIGNGRSITYTPKQIGVLLNLTGNSSQTIVSIIGKQKS